VLSQCSRCSRRYRYTDPARAYATIERGRVRPVASGLADHITNANQSSASSALAARSAAGTPSTTTMLASPHRLWLRQITRGQRRTTCLVHQLHSSSIVRNSTQRWEWHLKVVREIPNLHNNETSVIIGPQVEGRD
jgi:hypothetical protein